jgi:prepilin-type N-terminal cleavage/methylation domain-containing protein
VRKKAFTLVELLVVIAIIAMLIAMIMPSLNAAKDVVKVTYCRSTINALNKSIFVYTENSRGYMMVYTNDMYGGYARAGELPWHTYTCFNTASTIDPNTALFSDARGFGRIYALKLLAPAEMFYCPSPNATDQRQNLDYYPRPWGTAAAPGFTYIRNSYMWNPWVSKNPDGAHYVFDDSLMMSRHPNSRFLTSDLLDSYASVRHMTTVSMQWNMGFTDGHVYTYESGRYPSTSLYNVFKQQVDTSTTDWLDASLGYNAKVRSLLPQ